MKKFTHLSYKTIIINKDYLKILIIFSIIILLMFYYYDNIIKSKNQEIEENIIIFDKNMKNLNSRNLYLDCNQTFFYEDYKYNDLYDKELNRWSSSFKLFRTNCHCKNKISIGQGFDGNKILCGDYLIKDNCNVYSIGSFGELSYEIGIYNKYKCNITTIDMNFYKTPLFINFHQYKIGKCSNCIGLKNLLIKNNHYNDDIDILKIDIEGYEWNILDEIFINNFDLIQLEIHEMSEVHVEKLKEFTENWCLLNYEINTYCSHCLEIVFANKHKFKLKCMN